MRTIKGFTLIEMVVVIVVTGLVVLAASQTLSAAFTNYFTGVKVTTLTNKAVIAMARMTKELQQAARFTSKTATSTSFTTIGGSVITYSWATPTLTRVGTSSQTLSDEVTGFSIAYYQSDFSTAPTLSAVRAVTISMTLSNGSEVISLIHTVFLSNICRGC